MVIEIHCILSAIVKIISFLLCRSVRNVDVQHLPVNLSARNQQQKALKDFECESVCLENSTVHLQNPTSHERNYLMIIKILFDKII